MCAVCSKGFGPTALGVRAVRASDSAALAEAALNLGYKDREYR
jgi:hypothetical protein